MPRHVERNYAECFRKLLVGEQMPPLPSVRACRVQAHQRYARAVFLEMNAMHLTIDFNVDVAAEHRFDVAGHAGTTECCNRGSASTSLKYCRCVMNGCRSPSSVASSRLVNASRSCRHGSRHETGGRSVRAGIRSRACGRKKSTQAPARAAREFRQTPE